MAPPDLARHVSRRNLPANGENEKQTARALTREAARVVDDLGVETTPAGVRVLVARYVAEEIDQSLRSWVIAYTDPTGETAVRNVMRGAR